MDLDTSSYRNFVTDILQQHAPIRSFLNGIVYKFRKPNVTSEDGKPYIDQLLEWIESQEAPWAACLNIIDAHYPYLPAKEYDLWADHHHHEIQANLENDQPSKVFASAEGLDQLSALESLYDGGIRQVDALVEYLIEQLKNSGNFEPTMVTVTSDHGEGFGERSRVDPDVHLVDHSWGIDEELTHVPLLVNFPEQEDGHTVHEPASLTQFPAVVEGMLSGDENPTFVPNGPAIASTRRLQEKDFHKFDTKRVEYYEGPWRAVYDIDDGEIIKYASHEENAVQIRIEGTEELFVEEIDVDIVNEYFESVVPEDVGSRELSNETIGMLENLGYV